jgi:hypothetical protein
MPQARKSARSSSRSSSTFKEPAALKRLNRSLDSAQKALQELRTHAGRNAPQQTRALHKGVGKFISDARRDTGRFMTALKRDFDQAQKAAKGVTRTRTSTTSSGRTTRRPAARRKTRKTS